ncbi:unnamed protein product [Cercospora beticola]|nr:unnamed protein product [Cercospora beticola]
MRRSRSPAGTNSAPPPTKRRKTAKHDETDPLPTCSMTRKQKQAAQTLASAFAQDLAQHRGVSKEFENAYQAWIEAAKQPQFVKPVIGLYGPTGQGKSEFVNAFSGQPDASKSAGSGNALTSVAMLFVSHLHGQQRKHGAIVHIVKQDRLQAMVAQWVRDYVRFHFDVDPGLSEEELAERQKLADVAKTRFRTLFNNKSDFATDAKLFKFFENRRHDDAAIVEQLLAWCDELLTGFDMVDGHRMRRFEEDESSRLNEVLERYIYDQDGFATPLLWPLVELVEKACPDSPHLRYIHILDLPGMSDTDESRGNIAHHNILRCQALWVVGNISRATSDKRLHDILARYGPRFGKNIAALLTFSDANADANTARELEKQGADMNEYWLQTERVRAVIEDMANIKAQLEHTHHSDDQSKLAMLLLEFQSKTLPQSKTAQLDAFVKGRNSYVAAKMRETTRQYLPPGVELAVFCISNTHFIARSTNFDIGNTVMSLDSTNIPALRLHALSLAEDAKFNSYYDSINNTISLFESLALWTAANSKRPKHFEETLNAPTEHLESLSCSLSDDMRNALNTELMCHVAEGRTMFREKALEALREISRYHPSTFRAFVFRNGSHRTAAQESAVWDELFAGSQSEVIGEHWASLTEALKKLFQTYVDDMVKCPQIMFAKLTEDATDQKLVTMLEGLLHSYMNRIRAAYAQLTIGNDGVDTRLKIIMEKATKDVNTSYFGLALRHTYDACKMERGSGSTERMRQWLCQSLDRTDASNGLPCPFEAVLTGLDEDLTATVTELSVKLREDLDTTLTHLKHDLQRAYVNTTAARGTHELNAHKQLKASLANKQEEYDLLKAGLSELKQKYNIQDDELKRPTPKSFMQYIRDFLG